MLWEMSINATDLIQSYFDPDAVARLAPLVGLEPELAGQVLEAGLPLQLRALAHSARTPEGEAMIAETVAALPPFGSVTGALEESGGADHLQQAGEMLVPALLGEAADGLPAQVAAQTGADPARVQALLQLALPLLLSALGQRGLKAGNVAPTLLDLEGSEPAKAAATASNEPPAGAADAAPPLEPEGAEAVPAERTSVEPLPGVPEPPAPESMPLASEVMETPEVPVEAPEPPASAVPVDAAPTAPPDPSTPAGLLKHLQTRFGGAVGQQIGAVAGFGGGVRKQAALAALPVVLAALAGKAGAGGNLDTLAQPFAPLTSDDGQVNTALLDSPVEVARIEGQGRGLLASLFGDVNAVTGRLGSALGGSGDSSRRLLALLTPLVLSVLTRAHPGGLGAVPWGGLADDLKGALPPGFSSLGVLIASLTSGTPLPGAVSSTVQTTPRATVRQGPPASASPKPSPLKPPRPARFETPAAPPPPPARRRGSLPLWLIPLLLVLLLGGCWLVQNRQSAPPVTPVPETAPGTAPTSGTGTTPDATSGGAMPGMPVQPVFTAPPSGASVPAGGFALRGTGPAGEDVEVFLGDSPVGRATIGPDGTWSLDVQEAPTGPQTYTLRNGAGGEMAVLNVVVDEVDAAAADPTAAGNTAPDGTGGADSAAPETTATPDTVPATSADAGSAADLSVGSPASGAQVSGAGFTLSGTGTPGQSFEVLEDGVSIGRFTVGADGAWTRAVPAPGKGEKTYVIRSAAGDEVATVPVTVEAATNAQGAACTQPLSVSLNDGETVTAPYRFGGQGSGDAYIVTVKRGDRTVGRKTVPVGAGCGWSFTSNPGVRAGQAASVTYEIRPAGADASDAPGARLTLNVR